jgi:hypothetical protein
MAQHVMSFAQGLVLDDKMAKFDLKRPRCTLLHRPKRTTASGQMSTLHLLRESP